jgi:hypothetical protein
VLRIPHGSENTKNDLAFKVLIPFSLGISIFIISMIMVSTLEFRTSYGETGMGKDVFKVIVSVFDISTETGDIVTTVNVNGNSKVRSFDSDNLNIWPVSDNSSTRLIEYIATFPGIEVKPGDKYKACVLVLKTSNTICKEGTNSAGKRPEVVDISVNATPTIVTPKVNTLKVDTSRLDPQGAETAKVSAGKTDAEKTAGSEKVDTKDDDSKKVKTKSVLTENANTDGLNLKTSSSEGVNIFGN